MGLLHRFRNKTDQQTRVVVTPHEVGYQATPWEHSAIGGLMEWGKNQDMCWPQSVQTCSTIRDDSQVGSMLDAVTLPIMSTGWFIDPAGADKQVVAFIADNLGLAVRDNEDRTLPLRSRDRFSFSDHLRLALLEFVYGHSFFEQVYRAESGRIWLHKLAWRPPETISKIEVAPDGGLVAIEQYSTGSGTPRITIDRLVAYVNRREGGKWQGQSYLKRVYKFYILKEELLRILALADQRNGMGLPIYQAMPAFEGEDADKARDEIQKEINTANDLVKAVRAGDEAGVAIGAGAKFSLQGVSGKIPDILAHIRYCDEQISAAFLAHFLSLGQQSGTGSYALGVTFSDFFIQSLQTTATHIADVINQHVIEDLVDLNFGPTVRAPRLAFDEIGSKHPATAEALMALAQAKILLPEPNLESFVRNTYGLPKKADPKKTSKEPIPDGEETTTEEDTNHTSGGDA